jgi:hypothetical protein
MHRPRTRRLAAPAPPQPPAAEAPGRGERGAALMVALFVLTVILVLGAAMSNDLLQSLFHTADQVAGNRAFDAAEGGLHRALYWSSARLADVYQNSWTDFVAGELYVHRGRTETGQVGALGYEFWFEDNNDDADQGSDADRLVWIYSRAALPRGRSRTVRALVEGIGSPAALDYALFGNSIHFDNHNKTAFGVDMLTTVWSNSWIKVDSGIRIIGQMTGVEWVSLDDGPAGGCCGLPATVVSPAPWQGNGGATPPVLTQVPAPQVKPFPQFRFDLAKAAAVANGTYFANQAAFVSYLQTAANAVTFNPPGNCSNPAIPRVYIPTTTDLDQYFEVGDDNGNHCGEVSPVTVYRVIAPAATTASPSDARNNVLYVDGGLTLNYPISKYFRIEGSLIVDGPVNIKSGGWILAYEERDGNPQHAPSRPATASVMDYDGNGVMDALADLDGDGSRYDFRGPQAATSLDRHYSNWPAIAASGNLKIDKGDGATHIEGTIWTAEESHFHRSEANGKAFLLGSEIANVVHNCEFISFLYDPEVKNTLGFAEPDSGRHPLNVVLFDEQPPAEGTPPFLGN